MVWLLNIFKSKELVYLEQLYKETKEDKENLKTKVKVLEDTITLNNKELLQLKTHILELKFELKIINNNKITKKERLIVPDSIKKKLSPKEKDILDRSHQVKNFIELIKVSQMQEPSLRVYCSRIRNKGYVLGFEKE